ncbi:MAG TPA: VacB/RNase II family 3'-5' exoribonuclease [Edaphobacter sp.]|uniref:ribonuclease R family protein n=1 Tax=Edaphobacter sp. TaxID=1934404 RepID=UPI002C8F2320|nr:VacB/RNase II family 3'-5' exoribonuclease [Edaphobacter sp.]HUZ95427.1 VacB/RNase II family 3'-5' exoribonuclease [Edaphobacter sp.]
MAQTPYPRSDGELIGRIERSPGHRAGYKQLVREFGLGGGRERRLLLEQLARITARGELVKIDTEQWSLPAAAPEKTARAPRNVEQPVEHRATRDRLVAGKIDLHRDGYGFVRPNQSTSREDDLFIPPNELNGAMQGDEVLVDEAPPGRDGRRSGRVARVLTRRNPTVVGIFHYARSRGRSNAWENAPLINGNYVTPLDERMTQGILIPEGAEVAATPMLTPHRVLGEEAQAQQAHWSEELDPHWPLEGLAVDIEITDFPAPGRPARGRVLEVLGPPDAFGVDVEIIIRKHHLPYTFPANVLAEATDSAAQTVETLAADELERRRDFRGLSIVTIDGETARDFDDAVLVEPLANGNWQLQVHIADVSHYVRPGTALDLEARLRGTSVYFPDRAIPMLPNQLSSGMCSLRPDEDRLVLSCLMEIDVHGEVLGYELCEGIIRSARRMTYTQIQAVLDGDAATRAEFASLVPDFERMHELALKLNAKRHRRGSIDFDLPEPVVQFDPDGNMEAIVRSQRGWSHRLIEEFMLSANECVAHWIEAQGVPSIYRIHEMPDPKRIVDFEETASQFGYSLGFSSLPVKRVQMKADRRSVRGTTRTAKTHEVAESIPVTPQMYQRLTAKIAGKPEERILAYLMLRSLKQARYSEQNVGHFALASPSYTHFTSPIRRYPDLIVHRLLRDLLQGGANPHGAAILSTDPQPWREMSARKPGAPRSSETRIKAGKEPIPEAEIAAIATESSQAERRADDAERELIEWKKIRFMEDRVGEDFNAIILSCTKYGFFVELDDLFIEGLVPIATLQDDRYLFRDTDRQIVGARNGHVFKMGQRVHVLLDRIDRQQKRLQFALLPSEEEAQNAPGSLRKAKGKGASRTESAQPSPNRAGKRKTKERARNKKSKGKRKKS